MDDTSLNEHISKQFDEDLENIFGSVLKMGGHVEQQLANSLKSLIDSDHDLARHVIGREHNINKFEINVDEEAIRLLARRQPAASDLRLIMSVIKTVIDLERIGDEAQKIAKMALKLEDGQELKSYHGSVNTMGNHTVKMINGALDAFARMDTQAAFEVAKREPESDDQYHAILRQLIACMAADPGIVSSTLDVIWVIRALERIGDHARNICEYVIYFVEGKDVRHISIEQLGEEIS